jgi:tellurite resistance protein
MVKINTAAISALRKRLQEEGGAPSLVLTGPAGARQLGHPLADDEHEKALFDATFEVMFLMLAADGRVTDEEEEILRGAARELTGGVVRTKQILALMAECDRALDNEGVKARLEAVTNVLKKDTPAAEAAYVLAAVIALADEHVAPEENTLLDDIAEQLGLSASRVEQLLEQATR